MVGVVADAAVVAADGAVAVLVAAAERAWEEAAACRDQEGACRDHRHPLAVRHRSAVLVRDPAAAYRDRAGV